MASAREARDQTRPSRLCVPSTLFDGLNLDMGNFVSVRQAPSVPAVSRPSIHPAGGWWWYRSVDRNGRPTLAPYPLQPGPVMTCSLFSHSTALLHHGPSSCSSSVVKCKTLTVQLFFPQRAWSVVAGNGLSGRGRAHEERLFFLSLAQTRCCQILLLRKPGCHWDSRSCRRRGL
ncbi:hypothetical protein LX32DRAFT_250516 [Colletotrichum zoysiae]|uniref:Uncharacterized protein n=1 Tax=Colletotrichum zoysiae TaxID=1216348 RepID=A0AAD9H303_9PEZI|nr:hypothetical protein LX32DRAFT_250516 [Colletotrichum zoysiae]